MIDCLKLRRVSSNQLHLMKWISCHTAGQGSFYLLNRCACSETNDQATPLRKFAHRTYLMQLEFHQDNSEKAMISRNNTASHLSATEMFFLQVEI